MTDTLDELNAAVTSMNVPELANALRACTDTINHITSSIDSILDRLAEITPEYEKERTFECMVTFGVDARTLVTTIRAALAHHQNRVLDHIQTCSAAQDTLNELGVVVYIIAPDVNE